MIFKFLAFGYILDNTHESNGVSIIIICGLSLFVHPLYSSIAQNDAMVNGVGVVIFNCTLHRQVQVGEVIWMD